MYKALNKGQMPNLQPLHLDRADQPSFSNPFRRVGAYLANPPEKQQP